jgi:UDPglucose 6-dehydrogenase
VRWDASAAVWRAHSININFINEVVDLCERVGANVQDVARGIGLDRRIGSKFLHAAGRVSRRSRLRWSRRRGKQASALCIVEAAAETNVASKEGLAARIIGAL